MVPNIHVEGCVESILLHVEEILITLNLLEHLIDNQPQANIIIGICEILLLWTQVYNLLEAE